MPEWRDKGIVLSVRKYGESGIIANILTLDHGRHLGWISNYKNKNVSSHAQPGNLVDVFWKSRLIDQMGNFKIELISSVVGKILDDKINLTATCVRLPVMVSHSESVNIEFEKSFTLEKVREALDNFEGCKVIDERSDGGYVTPLEAEGKDETFISRIREDKTINNGLNMWIVSDNLLRGAALNSVEIAETLIKNNFYGK